LFTSRIEAHAVPLPSIQEELLMLRWSVPLVCFVVGGVATGFVARPMLEGKAAAPAAAVPAEMTSYRDVVKKVLPAVVSIEAHARPTPHVKRKPSTQEEPRTPEEFRKFFKDFDLKPFEMPETPDETPHGAFGSGFLVSPKGVILTNNHVVEGADQVTVTLKDGRTFKSTAIKTDPKTDLAIVRIDAQTPLPYLEMGDSDAMEIGDRVLAVGAPFGLTGTVTAGIVSAKGRSLHMNMYEDFLQTDAAINPGNSGGPLVNLEGQVIGIDSAIKSRSGGFQGIGLAIPSNMAKDVMEQLLENGVVHRGYFGVQIKNLDPEVAARLGVTAAGGVLVGGVFDGSPAAKAGIKEGDVITQLGGKPVLNSHDLQSAVAHLTVGKEVDVTVVRDGKPQTLHVAIAEQPKEFGTARVPSPAEKPRSEKQSLSLDKVGLEVTDATPDQAQELGFKGAVKGVLVTRVDPDSPAAEAGLHRGLLIVKADRKPVTSAEQFRSAVEKANTSRGLLLQVRAPEEGTNFVLLKVKPEQAATK
jgi:serine protease Do